MKREIIFRGKRIDNGEWVYSYFWHIKEHYNPKLSNRHCIKSIKNGLDYEVIPETVGQFTGLTDKNGVKIFEGDVIQWTFGKHYWEAVVQSTPESQSVNLYTLETFHNCTKDMETEEYTYERSDSRGGFRNDVTYLSNKSEVIGNIHDNPELLK